MTSVSLFGDSWLPLEVLHTLLARFYFLAQGFEPDLNLIVLGCYSDHTLIARLAVNLQSYQAISDRKGDRIAPT